MTKHTLVFATHNQHKLAEIKEFMPGWVELKSLDDIGYDKEIPETGTSLGQNALQKAYTIFSKTSLDCFSDDTGLEVDVLNGAPGVYSARYAGPNASFEENVNMLLKNMEGKENRKARFRTLIYLIFNGKKWLFEGVINGTITKEKHGSSGFGYDPVFQPEGYDKTFAEMSLEEKNKISHRGLAMIKMLNYFEGQEEGLSLAGQGEFA